MSDTTVKFLVLAVDKLLLAVVLVVLGYWLNRRLALFKSGRALLGALVQNRQKLEDELRVARRERARAFIEKQLTELYWPLYLRLQKDNVMWQRVRRLSRRAQDALPDAAGMHIEQDYILPNHAEAVALIETKPHLVDDGEVLEVLLRYVKHVAVYQAMRSTESLRDKNPDDLDEPYPEDLYEKVQRKLDRLRAEYHALLHEDVLDPAPPGGDEPSGPE